jgi:hypothetical protein
MSPLVLEAAIARVKGVALPGRLRFQRADESNSKSDDEFWPVSMTGMQAFAKVSQWVPR